MLRTSNGTEYLYDVFKRLGKPITKENAASMCALACQQPELFIAMGTPTSVYRSIMLRDIVDVYAMSRSLSAWCIYTQLMYDVLKEYGMEVYTDAHLLQSVFTSMDDKIVEIEAVLAKDTFPSLLRKR